MSMKKNKIYLTRNPSSCKKLQFILITESIVLDSWTDVFSCGVKLSHFCF